MVQDTARFEGRRLPEHMRRRAQRMSRARVARLLVVLFVVLIASLVVLSSSSACREDAAPTAAPTAESTDDAQPAVVVSGSCGHAPEILPPMPPAGDGWQPAAVELPEPCFELVALDADSTGVASDSEFLLSSAVQLTPEEVQRIVDADPPVSFEVVEEAPVSSGSSGLAKRWLSEADLLPVSLQLFSGASTVWAQDGETGAVDSELPHRYRLVPSEELPAGRMLKVMLHDAAGGDVLDRWAFQVRAPLRVVGTVPRDKATNVPINTGIEFSFSHEVVGVEDRFSIEPDVAGRFETRKRTVTFVPDEALRTGALYTVKLDSGVGVDGTATELATPYSFRFETSDESGDFSRGALQFSRNLWEQPTDEAPMFRLFGVYSVRADSDAKAEVTVHAYSGVEDFLDAYEPLLALPSWSWHARSKFAADSSELVPVAGFEAVLESMGPYGDHLLRFPEPLDAGYYLVDVETNGKHAQTFMQVTDLATYAAASWTKTLVWVNDVASGLPVSGATVSGRGLDATTDAEGVAFVDTPDELLNPPESPDAASEPSRRSLIVSDADGRESVLPLADQPAAGRSWMYTVGGASNLYWRYLYTDRQLYRPTDTIRFWGVVRTRDGGAPVDEVSVIFSSSAYGPSGTGSKLTASAVAAVSPDGTYVGELELEDVGPGWYSVLTYADGDQISSSSVEVRDFDKPLYQLEIETDRRVVFAGDAVTVTVDASFFEGSPVPGVALRVGGDKNATVTTNSLGEAEFAYEAVDIEYGPHWTSSVFVTPSLEEEGQIEASTGVLVVPAAVALDTVATVDGVTGVVSGTVRGVDLDRVNDDPGRRASDFQAEPLVGQLVEADVTEVHYERTQKGTAYNFVSKRSAPVYTHTRAETVLGAFRGTTGDDGAFRIEFPTHPGRFYELEVRAVDSEGRDTIVRRHAGTERSPQYGSGVSLLPESEGRYALGDSVRLRMVRGSDDLPADDLPADDLPSDDRYLFYEAQNGLRDYALTETPEYGFRFDEQRIPNVVVSAVHFNGHIYQETDWGHSVKFDPAERELTVAVEADRDRYRPRDEVTLSVTVSDAQGTPVRGRVLLSAIDAAIEAMQYDVPPDQFLQQLYSSVPSGVVSTYVSHQYPEGNYGAEGGGGGGQRSDFRDVVLFEEVETDATGRATITFPLPDNLTSWSIAALAVTDDLKAGAGQEHVPVGLPFFVDVTMNDEYLVSDKPVVRLRAFGESLKRGDRVEFKLAVDSVGSQAQEPLSLTGAAFEGVEAPLPALEEGQYLLRVAGQSGEFDDAIVRPLSVVASRLVATESDYEELGPGESLKAPADLTGPVTMAIYDATRGRFYHDLNLLSRQHGERLDTALGRQQASMLMADYFGDVAVDDGLNIQAYREDGGLALVPYGDADLDVTVRAAVAAPESAGSYGYLSSVVSDPDETPERVAAGYWGMASQGGPVLRDIERLLAVEGLEPIVRLYLGLAAAASGDLDRGAGVYRDLVAEYGERRGDFVRIDFGGDANDVSRATALAAILGANVSDDLSVAMYRYTTANPPSDAVQSLEHVAFLKQVLPLLPEAQARVAFSLDGSRGEHDVSGFQPLSLFLSPDRLASLDLEVLDGRVAVSTSRDEPIDLASVAPDPAVSVRRTYRVVAPTGRNMRSATERTDPAGVTLFNEGEMVRVTLDYELGEGSVSGCYELSDILPSGLRASTSATDPLAGGVGVAEVRPFSIVGQRVSFCVHGSDRPTRVRYYARVLGKGDFMAEPVILQSMTAEESIGFSNDALVEIR